MAQETLIISEFLAANRGGLVDADGDDSDWIEVYNAGAAALSTTGWSLTDDPIRLGKWPLPDIELGSGEFLIVFASGKDRSTPGEELHTNFKLSGNGEFLALVKPDGQSIATQFRPRYPPQFPHASFGRRMQINSTEFIGRGTELAMFVPSNETLGDTWIDPTFEDGSWSRVTSPIGYDTRATPTLADFIETDVFDALFQQSATVYLRYNFQVDDPTALETLLLRIRYDDGFVAYLNGNEIARQNAPNSLTWFSTAATDRDDPDVLEIEMVNLSDRLSEIRTGDNVLAVHMLNRTPINADLLFWIELEGRAVQSIEPGFEYSSIPSPTWANDPGFPGVASPPTFSITSSTLEAPTMLTLSTASPTAAIRFTTDDTEVTERSPLYSEPLILDGTRAVRARVFADGLVPSLPAEQFYVFLDPSMAEFSTNLPIIIISTQNAAIREAPDSAAHLAVIDGASDRNHPSDPLQFSGDLGIRVRGNSSLERPKKSFALETHDVGGNDRDVALLGMPAESDWVLYGAYNFDLTMLHNALMYELSNQVGRYAVRTKFCEVFINGGNAAVSRQDYVGVYSFMEKIKRGPQRVDVEQLFPSAMTEPMISGGYIFKMDDADPGDLGFMVNGQRVLYVDPKESDILGLTPQVEFVQNHFDSFIASLDAPDTIDPDVPIKNKSYAQFIDPDSWIDYHILNVFAKNVDGLQFSVYMFKPRNGPLSMGPLWDLDRALDSTDPRDNNPIGWNTGNRDYFTFGWWGPLFTDPVFSERHGERWLELRERVFRTRNLTATLDRMADEIAEAQARNFERWPDLVNNSPRLRERGWKGEVAHLREWLVLRAQWIDTQFLAVPEFSHPSQLVEPGFTFTISHPIDEPERGQIVYTLNGSDPRGPDGEPIADAILYSGESISVTENMRVNARIFSDGAWGDLGERGYVTALTPLVITEVHFNPLFEPGFRVSELEFVEIQNIGDEPISITGAAIGTRPAIEFTGEDITGSDLTVLQPGEYVVVIKDLEAFSARYDTTRIKIVGEWTPSNSSLTNAGQELVLFGPFSEELLRFQYSGDWYPSANGGGNSLVIVDPQAPRESWNEASSWRPSTDVHGSPGRADLQPGNQQHPSDLTQDGRLTLLDGIALARHLFLGVSNLPCATSSGNNTLLDANGDSSVNVVDIIHVLLYLFDRGDPPVGGVSCVSIGGCPTGCSQ